MLVRADTVWVGQSQHLSHTSRVYELRCVNLGHDLESTTLDTPKNQRLGLLRSQAVCRITRDRALGSGHNRILSPDDASWKHRSDRRPATNVGLVEWRHRDSAVGEDR
jgi:hypothetical protein